MIDDVDHLFFGKLATKYSPYQKKLILGISILAICLIFYFLYIQLLYDNDVPLTFVNVLLLIVIIAGMGILGILVHLQSKKTGLYQDQEYQEVKKDHMQRYIFTRVIITIIAVAILLPLFFLGVPIPLALIITILITMPLYFIIYKKIK